MTALEKLQFQNDKNKFICVGLDAAEDRLPISIKSLSDPIFEFNKKIISSTSEFTAAYKLNFAFYERLGAKGFEILNQTISLIPENILIIGDAKRGDIGNTSKMYAGSIYDYFECDALTINPYMGSDSVLPFLEYENKINFILALTSNSGANDFQKLKLSGGGLLFQEVIKKANDWNKKNNCGIVFGATKINELKDNINLFGNLPVLLPGVGAQGGSLEDVVKTFKLKNRKNYLINVSRGIIYKSSEENFAEAAKDELINLNKAVQKVLFD